MKVTKTMETETCIDLKDIESLLGISDVIKVELYNEIDHAVVGRFSNTIRIPHVRFVSRKNIEVKP